MGPVKFVVLVVVAAGARSGSQVDGLTCLLWMQMSFSEPHLRIDIWGDDLFVLDFETTLAIVAILIILTGTTPNSYNHVYSISKEAKV